MIITRTNQNPAQDCETYRLWHKLVIAEAGFSMLNTYCRFHHASYEIIDRFAHAVNSRDEAGSLYPQFPISAIPRRFMRDIPPSDAVPEVIDAHIADFERFIRKCVIANEQRIRARNILIDLIVDANPVPTMYCEAIERVLNAIAEQSCIEHVVIITAS